MTDAQRNYWTECIEISLEECDLHATSEQIESIAGDVEAGHDNYGMAFHVPESPVNGEIAQLKRELNDERAKVICSECNGRGRLISHGPCHSGNSECFVCRGEGRYLP